MATSTLADQTPNASRRKVAKQRRREQLIQATIDCISKRGFADTTLAHVSKQAGLSQGIVNLHFDSKENLLTETLRYVRDDYRQAWQQALKKSGDSPAEKVLTLLEVDFAPAVCDKKKLAVWFAFQGEAKSRPTYRKICEEQGNLYDDMFVQVLQELIDDGDYKNLDAGLLANMFTALCEGLWLAMLVTPTQMNRDKGMAIYHSLLTQYFPRHFPPRT